MSDLSEEQNQDISLRAVRDWLDEHKDQMFDIRHLGRRYLLKAFLAPDNKILWLEFRSTSGLPTLACPIGLNLPATKFMANLNREWGSLMAQVKSLMDQEFANG